MNLIRSTSLTLERQICSCQKHLFATPRRSVSDNQKDMDSSKKDDVKRRRPSSIEDLTEPTNCCMSGCANCVWIRYAEKLSNRLQKSDADIQKVIMEKVQDPNMRAFLAMELRCRNIVK